MTRVRWSLRASDDIESIFASVRHVSEAAAQKQVELIWSAGDQIARFPLSGTMFSSDPIERKLPIPGTKYVIYYRYRSDLAEITAVVHGSQAPPASFPA